MGQAVNNYITNVDQLIAQLVAQVRSKDEASTD